MKRKFSGPALLLGLLSFLFLPFTFAAKQLINPLQDTKHLLKQQHEVLRSGDWLEWISLAFDSNLPMQEPITHIRKAVEGRTTLMLHPLHRHIHYRPERLTRYPFLHVEMCPPPPMMDMKVRFYWRDFFNSGGTLFLDACPKLVSPTEANAITEAWKTWGQSIFPDSSWSPLNHSHVLSYSFYLLDKRMFIGKKRTPISLLKQDGRVILIHNRSRRWSWGNLKNSQVSVNLNPPTTEIHLRLYVNLFMLLLTGDYKSDQMHLPTILLRRR